jgi:hypothetical protein
MKHKIEREIRQNKVKLLLSLFASKQNEELRCEAKREEKNSLFVTQKNKRNGSHFAVE